MRKFLKMYGDNNSGRNTIMRLFLNNDNVISNISLKSPVVSAQYQNYSYFKDNFNFKYIDYLKLKEREVSRDSREVYNDYINDIDRYPLNILNANNIFFKKDVVLAKSDILDKHENYINFIESFIIKTIFIKRNTLIGIFTELDELLFENEIHNLEDVVKKIKKEYNKISKINRSKCISMCDKIIYHSDILTHSNKIKKEISDLLDIPFIPCTFKGYNKYLTNHEYEHLYSRSVFTDLKELLIKYNISFKNISYDEMISLKK